MENASSPCIAVTTWPVAEPVEPLARALIDERLAACVHISAAGTSWYRWQGAIETADERSVAIKTTRGRLAAAEARVRALHPYDLPEWLVIDVSGSDAYLAWIQASVTGA